MEIIEITGKNMVEEFHNVPDKVYRNDSNYIPLIRPMIEDIFSPAKNAKYKNGDARRWVLKTGDEYIGRIAAFFDKDYSSTYDQPTGCIGFFECVDNNESGTISRVRRGKVTIQRRDVRRHLRKQDMAER